MKALRGLLTFVGSMVLVAAAGAAVLLFRVGEHGISARDEPTYAETVRARVVIVVVEDKDKVQNVKQVLLGATPATEHKH